MKIFTCQRTHKEIKKACKEAGFKFRDEKYRKEGSDHVTFDFIHGKTTLHVCYNVFNGRAFGEVEGVKGVDWFSTDSMEHERKPWFLALLEFIYIS